MHTHNGLMGLLSPRLNYLRQINILQPLQNIKGVNLFNALTNPGNNVVYLYQHHALWLWGQLDVMDFGTDLPHRTSLSHQPIHTPSHSDSVAYLQ